MAPRDQGGHVVLKSDPLDEGLRIPGGEGLLVDGSRVLRIGRPRQHQPKVQAFGMEQAASLDGIPHPFVPQHSGGQQNPHRGGWIIGRAEHLLVDAGTGDNQGSAGRHQSLIDKLVPVIGILEDHPRIGCVQHVSVTPLGHLSQQPSGRALSTEHVPQPRNLVDDGGNLLPAGGPAADDDGFEGGLVHQVGPESAIGPAHVEKSEQFLDWIEVSTEKTHREEQEAGLLDFGAHEPIRRRHGRNRSCLPHGLGDGEAVGKKEIVVVGQEKNAQRLRIVHTALSTSVCPGPAIGRAHSPLEGGDSRQGFIDFRTL